MTHMKRIPTQAHLDPDLHEWVQAKAKHERCSVSQVFRNLIAQEMRQEERKKEGANEEGS